MTELKEKQSLHTFNNQLKLLQQLKCLVTEQSFKLENVKSYYREKSECIFYFLNAKKSFSETASSL